jgi:hypothetical protein
MSDFIIVDGDQVMFLPPFGSAIVVPIPTTITGSGENNATKKKACVDGDETSVESAGCMYMAPPYVIPGTGTLKIDKLAGDQLAKKSNSGGKAVMLKGAQFDAVFEVQSPAQMPAPPAPPVPDSMTKYSGGKGMFINSNMTVKAG